MTPRNDTEKVTMRDLLDMQQLIYTQVQKLDTKISNNQARVAWISGGIAALGFVLSVAASFYIAN